MRCAYAILICCLALPSPVHAGAWLRENGTWFLSVVGILRHQATGTAFETDIFADYGLTPRLSTGISIHANAGADGHTLAFLRWPIGSTEGDALLSLSAAAGGYRENGVWQPMARLGWAWGRGFRWGEGWGWVDVDAAVEYRATIGRPLWKLDAVVGQSTGALIRPMFKLETTQISNRPLIWSVSANMLISRTPGKTLVIGLEHKHEASNSIGLRFGLWREF